MSRADTMLEYIGASMPPTAGAIRAARDRLGIGFIELISPFDEKSLKEIKDEIDDSRVGLLQVHAPTTTEADIANYDEAAREHALKVHEEQLEHCSLLGAGTYVIHPGGLMYGTWDEKRLVGRLPSQGDFWRRVRALNVSSLKQLSNFAAEHGMKLALENGSSHDFHYRQVLRIVREVRHPSLGVCFDTGHANIEPLVKLPHMIRDIAPLLWASHLHDNDGTGDQHLPPGKGNIDWHELLAAFRGIDYHGMLSLELFKGRIDDQFWSNLKDGANFLSLIAN